VLFIPLPQEAISDCIADGPIIRVFAVGILVLGRPEIS